MDRETVLAWLDRGLVAVDARRLTAQNLSATGEDTTIIAIGKAAVAMCWGAADALGDVSGICVADTLRPVPERIELMVGDHPVPGPASLRAGRAVLELARNTQGRCVALISGGGSALCEQPFPGVDERFISEANRALLVGGASIGEMNLVRSHLSAIKGGGLARALGRPIETLIISDVAGRGPDMVASGPTIDIGHRPDLVLDLLRRHPLELPEAVAEAIRRPRPPVPAGEVTVIGDGQTAAKAIADAAQAEGVPANVDENWIDGTLEGALGRFFDNSQPGVTVAAGEPELRVGGDGSGGRNTHAALLAAIRIAGSDQLFAALASDGVDGATGSAGALVDGSTLDLGGDPEEALSRFDSATYLGRTGSLVPGGATGTNVGDLWVCCR